MKRVKDNGGVVHFEGARPCVALCGESQVDLLNVVPMKPTSDAVTCSLCARLYCQIKNAPWNEIDGNVLYRATYDAVKE